VDRSLRLGLEIPLLPQFAPATSGFGRNDLLGTVEAAACAAFDSVWLGGSPASTLDGCTVAGGIADASPVSMTLGIVASLVGRRPGPLARDITALDVVSGGRAAVLFECDGEIGKLAEAAVIGRLLFGGGAPSFAGEWFTIEDAANRPAPIRPGGPPVLAQIAASDAGAGLVGADGDRGAAGWRQLLGQTDAIVVDGTAPSVAGSRAGIDRIAHRLDLAPPPVIWRGELPQDPVAAEEAIASVHAAGVHGLILRLDGAPPRPDAVEEAGALVRGVLGAP